MKYDRKECLQVISVSSIIILKIDIATTIIDIPTLIYSIAGAHLFYWSGWSCIIKKRDFWLKITVWITITDGICKLSNVSNKL